MTFLRELKINCEDITSVWGDSVLWKHYLYCNSGIETRLSEFLPCLALTNHNLTVT